MGRMNQSVYRAYIPYLYRRGRAAMILFLGLSIGIPIFFLVIRIFTGGGLYGNASTQIYEAYSKFLPVLVPLFYLTTKDELTLIYEKKKGLLSAFCSLPWEPRHLLFLKSFLWSLYLEAAALVTWLTLLVFNLSFLHIEVSVWILAWYGILPWFIIFPLSLVVNYLILSLPLNRIQTAIRFIRFIFIAGFIIISFNFLGSIFQTAFPVALASLLALWFIGLILPFFINKDRIGIYS